MTSIGRRHFFAVFGAGLIGASGTLAGCSGSASKGTSGTAAAGGSLAGLSFDVHRDPG